MASMPSPRILGARHTASRSTSPALKKDVIKVAPPSTITEPMPNAANSKQGHEVHAIVGIGRQHQDGGAQRVGFSRRLAGAASVTASTVPEAAPFASTAASGCAQGAVNDHTQGTRATDVANRQTGIVLADRAGADEDGVVTGAHLVGEAQRVGAADPLGFPRRGRHAPVERLRVAHGDERPVDASPPTEGYCSFPITTLRSSGHRRAVR